MVATCLRLPLLPEGTRLLKLRAVSYRHKYAASQRADRRAQPGAYLARGRLHKLARRVHLQASNRERAIAIDDIFVDDGEAPPKTKGMGTGKWKQLPVDAVLRCTFAPPAQSVANIAKSLGRSPRYITDLKFMVAKMLARSQDEALAAIDFATHLASAAGFLVVQMAWDESSFYLVPCGDRAGVDVSLLASRAAVLWKTPGGILEKDLVLKPEALEFKTAAGLYAGLGHSMMPTLWGIITGSIKVVGVVFLNTGSDHASSNLMLLAHLANIAPGNVLMLPGLCKQHGAALCLSPVAKDLEIICGLYCLSKLFRGDTFRRQFQGGMKVAIDAALNRVLHEDDPNFEPDGEDAAHATGILEATYYKRDLRTTKEDTRQGLEEKDKYRRAQGRQLHLFCPGNWRKRRLLHVCRGCCASRQETVDKIYKMLVGMKFDSLSVPALNKWLSLYPLACDLVFMLSFHRVFLDALVYALKRTTVEQEDLSGFSEGETLGAPQDDQGFWHKQERRRALKALGWIEDRATYQALMLFVHSTGAVIYLHYWCFKHVQTPPAGCERSPIFDLCNPSSPDNVGVKVLMELTTMMFESAWGFMRSVFGEFSGWPAALRRSARGVVFALAGTVWRRFVKAFEMWPWMLAPLADPDVLVGDKIVIAAKLFDAPACCLDRAFSFKLRVLAGTPDALLGDEWQEKLFHAFNKASLSNASLECTFAHFGQWLMRSSKPCSVAHLQAKQLCEGCLVAYRSEQAEVTDSSTASERPLKVARPAWAFKSREAGRSTARHTFIGDYVRAAADEQHAAFKRAGEAWREVGLEERQRQKQKAAEKNAQKRTHKESALQKASDELEKEHWPLQRAQVVAQMATKDGVLELANDWKQNGRRIEEDEEFPEGVPYDHPCLLCSLTCKSVVPDDCQATYGAIFEGLQVIFAPRCLKVTVPENMLLISNAANENVWWLVRCFSCLRTRPFSGEFAVFASAEDRAFVVPYVARLARGPLRGIGSPDPVALLTETDLIKTIALTTEGPMAYHTLTLSDTGCETLHQIDVLAVGESIDIEVKKREVLDHLKARRALKMFERSLLPWYRVPKPRRRRRARGPGDGGAGINKL